MGLRTAGAKKKGHPSMIYFFPLLYAYPIKLYLFTLYTLLGDLISYIIA